MKINTEKDDKKETTKDVKDVKDVKEKDAKDHPKETKDPDTAAFDGKLFCFIEKRFIICINLFSLDIKDNIKFLEKGVTTKESRFIVRVLRTLVATRKRLNDQVLKKLINNVYIQNQYQNDKEFLLTFLSIDVQV